MAKKISKKEEPCCSGGLTPVWAILFVVVGAVWIVEHYTRMDVPLVAILLIIIGLYYLIKRNV